MCGVHVWGKAGGRMLENKGASDERNEIGACFSCQLIHAIGFPKHGHLDIAFYLSQNAVLSPASSNLQTECSGNSSHLAQKFVRCDPLWLALQHKAVLVTFSAAFLSS